MNENGVGVGESSCSARLFGSYKQGAIMSMDELTRIAMERATSAREAIQIVGKCPCCLIIRTDFVYWRAIRESATNSLTTTTTTTTTTAVTSNKNIRRIMIIIILSFYYSYSGNCWSVGGLGEQYGFVGVTEVSHLTISYLC